MKIADQTTLLVRVAALSEALLPVTRIDADPTLDAACLVAIALSTSGISPQSTVLEEGAQLARLILANRHLREPM